MSLFDNPSAFAPMYDQTVGIEGDRIGGAKVRGSFAACVFPIVSDDPLADIDEGTDRKRISVTLPSVGERAWNLSTRPQVGDTLIFEGERYSVYKVTLAVGGDFNLEARL